MHSKFIFVSNLPLVIRLLCSPVPSFIFIYSIILLCADIPVPEFKNAVIMLLCTSLVTGCILVPICMIPSRAVGAMCVALSIAISTASLGVVCARWRQALETADEWAVPSDVDPSRIPLGANPNLWKLVRNEKYGIGVIVGAALELAVNILSGLAWGAGAYLMSSELEEEMEKRKEEKKKEKKSAKAKEQV